MNNKKQKKYLLIWDRLGDYHRARWKALQDQIGAKNAHVADLGGSDQLYHWKNTSKSQYYHQLSDKPLSEWDFWSRTRNFIKVIRNSQIDVVALSGYGRLEYLLFILLTKLLGKQLILFAESWYPGNLVFDKLKGMFLKAFVDGFFVSGIRAERHFHQRLGIPIQKIVKGYSVVDHTHFSKSFPKEKSGNLSSEDISSHQPYLLCVARYSKEKNLPFLIEAYRQSSVYKKWKLVLIGDGPQKQDLEQLVDRDQDYILLKGWVCYEDIPIWYQNAVALVLPSTFEPWGLVVNESLAAGTRVLASTACGCVDDLLNDYENSIFDPIELESLIKTLDEIFIKENDIQNPISIDEYYSCENWAINLRSLEA